MRSFLNLTIRIFVSALSVGISSAASFYLSPQSGEFDIGERIPVYVMVGGQGSALNATGVDIKYDTSKFKYNSFSKTGSIIDAWVREPSVVNGSISFEGVLLSPGFSGANGLLLTLYFTALSAGVGTVSFENADAFAHDGNGTELPSTLRGSSFAIVQPRPVLNITQSSVGQVNQNITAPPLTSLVPPQIISTTHPVSGGWSNAKSADFTVLATSSVSELFFSVSTSTRDFYESIKKATSVARLLPDEGEYVVKAYARYGKRASEPTLYTLKIDTTPPSDVDAVIKSTSPYDQNPLLTVSAEDTLSGIERYEVSYAGVRNRLDPRTGFRSELALQNMPQGTTEITIAAFDAAGNGVERKLFYELLQPEAPEMLSYTATIKTGQKFELKAKTHVPGVHTITIKNESGQAVMKEEKVKQAEDEIDYFFSLPVEVGKYKVFIDSAVSATYRSEEKLLGEVIVKRSLKDILLSFVAIVSYVLTLLIALGVYSIVRSRQGSVPSPQSP